MLVIAGAAIGAPLRYFVQARVHSLFGFGFPYGTLAVNVTGCFLIGVLATLAEERGLLNREMRVLLLVGALGSYTTFSTFGWETLSLLRNDQVLRAALNVGLSTVAGVLAAWLGMTLARAPWS